MMTDSNTHKVLTHRNSLENQQSEEQGTLQHHEDSMELIVLETSPHDRFQKYDEEVEFGPYKRAYKAYDMETGTEVVWNTLRIHTFTTDERKQMIKTLYKLKKRNNTCILLNVVDYWTIPKNQQIHYITQLSTGGSLQKYLAKLLPPKLKIVKQWALDLITGLQQLRETLGELPFYPISLSNILINSSTNQLKLSPQPLIFPSKILSNYISAVAPQIFQRTSCVDRQKAEIFGFGQVFLQIITCKVLSQTQRPSYYQTLRATVLGEQPQELSLLTDSCQLKNIIKKCIAKDPKKRYQSISQLSSLEFWKPNEERDLLRIEVKSKGKPETETQIELPFDQPIASENPNDAPRRITKLNSFTERIQQNQAFANTVSFSIKVSDPRLQAFEIKVNRKDFTMQENFNKIVNFLTNRFQSNNCTPVQNQHPQAPHCSDLISNNTMMLYAETETTKNDTDYRRTDKHLFQGSSYRFLEPANWEFINNVKTLFLQAYDHYRSNIEQLLRECQANLDDNLYELKLTLEKIEKMEIERIWSEQREQRFTQQGFSTASHAILNGQGNPSRNGILTSQFNNPASSQCRYLNMTPHNTLGFNTTHLLNFDTEMEDEVKLGQFRNMLKDMNQQPIWCNYSSILHVREQDGDKARIWDGEEKWSDQRWLEPNLMQFLWQDNNNLIIKEKETLE